MKRTCLDMLACFGFGKRKASPESVKSTGAPSKGGVAYASVELRKNWLHVDIKGYLTLQEASQSFASSTNLQTACDGVLL